MKYKKIIFFLKIFTLQEIFRFYFLGSEWKASKGIVYSTYRLFENFFKEKVQIKNQGQYKQIQTNVNGRIFSIGIRKFSSDILAYEQIIRQGEFVSLIDLFREKSFVPIRFIDGGANIGLVTLYLKSLYPEMQVIAVEPMPDNVKLLKSNLMVNEISHYSILEQGIWFEPKQMYLSKLAHSDGLEWSFGLTDAPSVLDKAVRTVTITNLMENAGWEWVDFLKLDIEGAEDALFERSEYYGNWLPKVKVISLEIHDHDVRVKIENILRDFNFSIRRSGELTIGFNI